jgi:cyclophilin family peptidyl-prolyl cis-trans isomerase
MIKKTVVCLAMAGLIGTMATAQAAPQVKLETSLGDITIELNSASAPKTVANFLSYVNAGFYDRTIFHRVKPGFMIQGGGFTPDMTEKSTKAPIKNEAANGLKNVRGTVAMARLSDPLDPHTATAQFFINTVDNDFLNHKSNNPEEFGYCVFGKVVKGMDVVDSIAKTPTTRKGMYSDVPAEPVIIKKATVVKEKPAENTKIKN